jgi:putative oxidoreductase
MSADLGTASAPPRTGLAQSASRRRGTTATARLAGWSPQVLAILRIMTALLFIEHGLMKIDHFPAAIPGVPDPLPPLLMVAGLIEVVGGAMIVLGLSTRLAAFISSGEMAAAYFMIHAQQSFWPALNQGDAAILFCSVFFYLVFAGPGAWSLDALLEKGPDFRHRLTGPRTPDAKGVC